ncbi:MAG TPA: DUF374 domain-containing protein [Xanthobacteraceae bacterium]|nr:DUF374 domain-containing protein [Xanthobacteraceae bacterium]
MRRVWKTVRVSRPFQVALGRTLASYLRLVWNSSSLTIEPADLYDRVDREIPFILTFWHGQHFLMPFVMKSHHEGKVMISRHADADINAIAAEAFGVGTIRGSGAHGRDFLRKGGISATKLAIDTLKSGINVAMTADVPKISRIAGFGVVTVAKYSGRPIFPIAIATRNRRLAKSWDRASIHLPFGPAAMVVGDGVQVSADADDAALDRARLLVQERLNKVTERAEELVGRPPAREPA